MAPRKRTKDKWLPEKVYLKHGAYYFTHVINGKKKWIRLGKSLAEAMNAYSQLAENTLLNDNTMNALFDRYMKEVSPTKAKNTHKKDIYSIKYLKQYFGQMTPATLQPHDVYKYMDSRAKVSTDSANTEKRLLSRVLSAAIRWGLIKENICKEVECFPEKTRDFYLEDKWFTEFYDFAPTLLKASMIVDYLTALRQDDMLNIKWSDLKAEGIEIQASKTHKKFIITWTQALREAVALAKSIKQPIGSLYLFANKEGQRYTVDGFKAIWSRYMRKAIAPRKDKKTGIIYPPALSQRFMFKDIRAKAASDIEQDRGIQFAQDILQHSDVKTTRKHYLKRIQKVAPTR